MASFKRHGRKLLVASVGVAAVSYVAAGGCGGSEVVANLMVGPREDAGVDDATDAPKDNNPPFNWDVVANLVAPPRD
jgi:hypothetical protein